MIIAYGIHLYHPLSLAPHKQTLLLCLINIGISNQNDNSNMDKLTKRAIRG